MVTERIDEIKKAVYTTAGVIFLYGVYVTFIKPVDLKAPGREPPRKWLWQHIPWYESKGPIGSHGYAQLMVSYFEEQNYKSFWGRIPNRPPQLETADPAVMKEVFSCPFKWIKSPNNIYRIRDFLGYGIFNTNGQKWRIQRKQASYVFSEASLRDVMLPVMKTGADKLVSKLATLHSEEPYDIQKGLHDLFMDTFCEIAFGWDSNVFDTNSTFGFNYDRIFELLLQRALNPLWKIYRLFGIGTEKELAERIDNHKTIIRNVVVAAIEKKGEEKTNKSKNLIERLLDISVKGEPLTEELLVDFVSNFLIAGRDTTAVTMTWAIYNTMKFPGIREKLLEEIRRVRKSHPDNLYTQIKNMIYTEAFIWESMRFYSPVPRILKHSTQQVKLKDGTVIPKDTSVSIRVQASSWNPDIWENPREFRPERHLKNGKLSIKPAHEFPTFNGGKRLCLGKNMAIMNAKMMLSELISRFEFSLCEDKPAPVQNWMVTSKSSTGMWIRVKDCRQELTDD